ncbi:Porimin [Heterocephalus glaber]|uniref:Porimin n=1 Tax=Heterocephalus glaber TaxID=10181 RepID=G5BH19_HETGA|nr:Porimin [Heterocephalus glaber]
MGLGVRGARAALLLGALQVLALAGAAQPPASPNTKIPVPLHDSSGNLSETMPFSNASTSNSSSTVKPLTAVSLVSINVTAVTMKSTSKMATPGVSTNTTTPTTSKSTTKVTSISQNVSQMSTPMMTTTHSSLVTLLTTTVHSKENRGSKFDTGSFVGGIVLTLGVLSILYIGCKMYYSRRGIRYRTIDEHDAII